MVIKFIVNCVNLTKSDAMAWVSWRCQAAAAARHLTLPTHQTPPALNCHHPGTTTQSPITKSTSSYFGHHECIAPRMHRGLDTLYDVKSVESSLQNCHLQELHITVMYPSTPMLRPSGCQRPWCYGVNSSCILHEPHHGFESALHTLDVEFKLLPSVKSSLA